MVQEETNVVPVEMTEPVGIELNVFAHFIEPDGRHVPFPTTLWVSKDAVSEVISSHATQPHRCTLHLKNGKSIQCQDSYNDVTKKLERKRCLSR
jgi:hypothetical protein